MNEYEYSTIEYVEEIIKIYIITYPWSTNIVEPESILSKIRCNRHHRHHRALQLVTVSLVSDRWLRLIAFADPQHPKQYFVELGRIIFLV
jgi:hypothetical protein